MDPNFRAIDLICEMVQSSVDKAEFATLDEIFQRYKHHS